MFSLAMIQMKVEGGEKSRNLDRAEAMIASAARSGAKIALLPEALNLGWTHPSALEHADAIPGGESCDRLREAARREQIFVCAGLIERAEDQIFNAAVLIGPGGDLLLHHRKLNELGIGHDLYGQGDRLAVAKTPLATFGLVICADAYVEGQVITRTLGYMGADVILSPCAWAVPPDHDNQKTPYGDEWRGSYGPVARDFKMWIAGASNVGQIGAGAWKGWNCIGCSLLVGPDGKPALQGPYGAQAEAILYLDVQPQPRPARGAEWTKQWKRRGRGPS